MKVKELIDFLMEVEDLEAEVFIPEAYDDGEGEEYTIEREPIIYQYFDKIWL